MNVVIQSEEHFFILQGIGSIVSIQSRAKQIRAENLRSSDRTNISVLRHLFDYGLDLKSRSKVVPYNIERY